jgi:chromate transporter
MGVRRLLEVFTAFLRLGLTAFGGPIAHLGYFRAEFVERRKWLGETAYADIVTLCQFLPGPASSQVGVTLGLQRAGLLGALAAWCGFTLPSAVLMTAFAFGAAHLQGALAAGLIHGLKLVAVAVVAQAVLGMARSLTSDAKRAAIAVVATAIVTATSAAAGQILAMVTGALAGLVIIRDTGPAPAAAGIPEVSKRLGVVALLVFFLVLLGGPLIEAATGSTALARFDAFYRSGALVFGGGHVVLPLLQDAVVARGWVDQGAFLSGYGAAQAIPGPLFTFAAYLGAAAHGPPNGLAGAAIGLAGIFIPGLLAVVAALPFWNALRESPGARAAMQGANASVVGILAAALYSPVWTSAVVTRGDFAAVLAGFVLLTAFRAPPLLVVLLGALFGLAQALSAVWITFRSFGVGAVL